MTVVFQLRQLTCWPMLTFLIVSRDLTTSAVVDWAEMLGVLDHMQVCTSLQTDNHASTPPLSFLQACCHSCHPTNSVKALKAAVTEKPLDDGWRLQSTVYCGCRSLLSWSSATWKNLVLRSSLCLTSGHWCATSRPGSSLTRPEFTCSPFSQLHAWMPSPWPDPNSPVHRSVSCLCEYLALDLTRIHLFTVQSAA